MVDIEQLLPKDNYDALVASISTPSASNAYATIADLSGFVTDNLYIANGTVGAGRTATITDTLTFSGGAAFINTNVVAGNTVHRVVGTSALTFNAFGDLTQLTTGGSFDVYGGYYDAGAEPAFQAQLYDNTTFVENACVFVGVADFSGTDRPYASLYYTVDNLAFTGFQADILGEQLYTQRSGVVVTSLTSSDRVLFTNPTGYIKATTYADIIIQLGFNITDDVIPRGTGTSIENGTWSNVGNDIYPVTTGSNIGQAANRIGTLFMSSTVDYSTDLNFNVGANNYNTFLANGQVHLAKTGGSTTIGDTVNNSVLINNGVTQQSSLVGTTFTGFYAYNNVTTPDVQTALVANRFGYTAIRTSHDFRIENGWTGGMGTSSTARFTLFSSTNNVSIGTSSNLGRLRVQGSDAGVGTIAMFVSGSTLTGGFQVQNDNRVGVGALGTTAIKFNVRGIGNTAATIGLQVQDSSSARKFAIADNGVAFFNTTSPNVNGAGNAGLMVGTAITTDGTLSPLMDFTYRQDPSVDGSGRKRGLYVRTIKVGAFNCLSSIGIVGEGYNGGTGDYTNASLGITGVLGQARNIGVNTTIQNMFGLDGNAQTQAGVGNEATIVNMGALRLRLDQIVDTNITNLYGISLNSPLGGTNSIVTNYYAFRARPTTIAVNNWGLYIEGAATQNYIQGSLSVGVTTASANALVELVSTDKAFLIMRMTAVQASAIAPADGMMLYVTSTDATFTAIGFWGRQSGVWTQL